MRGLFMSKITKAFVFLSNDDSSVWSMAKYKTKELLDIDDKMLFEYKIDDILGSDIKNITFSTVRKRNSQR